MDLATIRKLVRLMESADLTELEIDDSSEGMRVHLRRGSGDNAGAAPVVHVVPSAGAPAPVSAAPVAAAPAAAGAPGSAGGASDPAAGHPPGTVPFPSPMVGTFYRSPSPDADAFVSPGTTFDEETTLCIIEAMKVMNEVKAESKGEIVELLVENGEPVEFGQPLFLIKPH